MREYEVTYLSDPQLNEEARAELDASVDSEVGQMKGQISHSAPNLRRRLLYPINKKLVGFSRTIQVTIDPNVIGELRTSLRKKSGLLRLMIINTPQRAEVPADIFTKASASLAEGKTAEAVKKPVRKVTMKEVEKGIEEALKEEVK